jgi:hypothetical protein
MVRATLPFLCPGVDGLVMGLELLFAPHVRLRGRRGVSVDRFGDGVTVRGVVESGLGPASGTAVGLHGRCGDLVQ